MEGVVRGRGPPYSVRNERAASTAIPKDCPCKGGPSSFVRLICRMVEVKNLDDLILAEAARRGLPSETSMDVIVIAYRLCPRVPPPSSDGLRRVWLLGVARRLGLVPWPSGLTYKSTKPPTDFFRTRAWRALRYRVLKKHGGKCQCCGATARSSGAPLHVDHIKPRSKFPELALEEENLQALCNLCNMGKSNTDETDWRCQQEPTAFRNL